MTAADRARRLRQRRAEGIHLLSVELPDDVIEDFANLAVKLEIIEEGEAATPEGIARAIGVVVEQMTDSWMAEKLEGGDYFAPNWGSSVGAAPQMTPAERIAWVRSQGLENASRHELQEAVKAAGLWHRWG